MNPYVSFGLAMCLVVGLSLFLTAYLAVVFNRRAKADLLAALSPLAEILNGEVDVEEAMATGRFEGHIAEGRAANSPDGPGKVFFTSVIDSAGGESWKYTIQKPKEPGAEDVTKFEGPGTERGAQLNALVEKAITPLISLPGWMRAEYDAEVGHVRITRPMATRRDIPSAEMFERMLKISVAVGEQNRIIQQQSPESSLSLP